MDGPGGTEHTLVLMRHAKSDWTHDVPDFDRPLAKRGRRQAAEAGDWLRTGIDRIDLAVVSSAARTRSTWDLVAAGLDAPPKARADDRLYAASLSELLAVVHELADDLETVVLVGHNPGIEDLVEHLTGSCVPMPTSALALVTVPGRWESADRGSGRLRSSGRPPPA